MPASGQRQTVGGTSPAKPSAAKPSAAKPSPANPSRAEDEDRVEIRLPFLTITRGGGPDRPGTQPAGEPGSRAGLEKLVFYGGAAALAAFGVVDWPVAALVAAGAYLAQKSRGSSAGPSRPPAAEPGGAPTDGTEAPTEKRAETPRPAAQRRRTSPRS